MARRVLVPLCLWWALGPAAASAPPNLILLLMDDVSGAGGVPGDGTLVTGGQGPVSLGESHFGGGHTLRWVLGWREGTVVTGEGALFATKKGAGCLSAERGLGSWEGGHCG